MRTAPEIYDYSYFPTLETERLILREMTAADAPDVFVFRGDYEVQKFNDDVLPDVEATAAFIENLLGGQGKQRGLVWGITLRPSDTVLGICGFNYWDKQHNRAEIGYDLARAWWGQGIGTEAVGTMVRFGFERMGLNRIEAHALIDNIGSVRVLEKLGFRLEGTRRQFTLEDDGAYHDGGIFGLLREEYFK